MRCPTAHQKRPRVNVCEELRQIASDYATFLSGVITRAGFTVVTPRQSDSPRKGKSKLTETGKGVADDMRGLFIKNSSWQSKKSITHTAMMFHGECVEMCEDFAPKFG
jgi:hypothetical protein